MCFSPPHLPCFDAMFCNQWLNEREAASHYKAGSEPSFSEIACSPPQKMCPETTRQAPYCVREVGHSLVKWVRGESHKLHVLTTCDPHLNSFHHDISLNQDYKRLHCMDFCGLGWTRVIVVHKKKKNAESRLKFSFLHQWKWRTKQIPSEENELISLWFSSDIILQCMFNG